MRGTAIFTVEVVSLSWNCFFFTNPKTAANSKFLADVVMMQEMPCFSLQHQAIIDAKAAPVRPIKPTALQPLPKSAREPEVEHAMLGCWSERKSKLMKVNRLASRASSPSRLDFAISPAVWDALLICGGLKLRCYASRLMRLVRYAVLIRVGSAYGAQIKILVSLRRLITCCAD